LSNVEDALLFFETFFLLRPIGLLLLKILPSQHGFEKDIKQSLTFSTSPELPVNVFFKGDELADDNVL